MSANIDSVKYISGKLEILRGVARRLTLEYEDELAESNLLDDLPLQYSDGGDDEFIPIDEPCWNGERSGNEIETFRKILGHTRGEADLLLTWDGGDRFTGLRVRNGKIENAYRDSSLTNTTGGQP